MTIEDKNQLRLSFQVQRDHALQHPYLQKHHPTANGYKWNYYKVAKNIWLAAVQLSVCTAASQCLY